MSPTAMLKTLSVAHACHTARKGCMQHCRRRGLIGLGKEKADNTHVQLQTNTDKQTNRIRVVYKAGYATSKAAGQGKDEKSNHAYKPQHLPNN